MRGSFEQFSAAIDFDPQHLDASAINLEVKVASINTGNSKRDTHLRSKDFFDAAAFPVLRFQSTKIIQTGAGMYAAEGTITIKETKKTARLEFSYPGEKAHPAMKGKLVSGLDSRFILNRLEYGVGDGRFYDMGLVGREVSVLITLEMLRDQ